MLCQVAGFISIKINSIKPNFLFRLTICVKVCFCLSFYSFDKISQPFHTLVFYFSTLFDHGRPQKKIQGGAKSNFGRFLLMIIGTSFKGRKAYNRVLIFQGGASAPPCPPLGTPMRESQNHYDLGW